MEGECEDGRKRGRREGRCIGIQKRRDGRNEERC